MKLGTVLSAVNSNPHYMSFVPQFIRAWRTLFPKVRIIVVYVGESLPEEWNMYRDYIHVVPIDPSINDVLASQCIRLLYPRFLDGEDGVLITDIDMIPMNSWYYEKPLSLLSNETVVVYRHGLPYELYMCYVCASPSVWKGMFGDEDHETILRRWFLEANVWNKDQTELTKAFTAWQGPKQIYTDQDTGFRRFCRSFLEHKPGTAEYDLVGNRDLIQKCIRRGFFSDYHAISNTTHKDLNEFIVDCLAEQVNRSLFVSNGNWSSYIPLLYIACTETTGPIIECGMGDGSTNILHSLGRQVVSYDTSKEWLDRFNVTPKHLVYPNEWVDIMQIHKPACDVFLIDQAPGESREKCIQELSSNFAGIIVAHDTEPSADYGYKMRQHFSKFRYVVEIKTSGAWATAMSNKYDLHKWIGESVCGYTVSHYDPELVPPPAAAPSFVIQRGLDNTIFTKLRITKE